MSRRKLQPVIKLLGQIFFEYFFSPGKHHLVYIKLQENPSIVELYSNTLEDHNIICDSMWMCHCFYQPHDIMPPNHWAALQTPPPPCLQQALALESRLQHIKSCYHLQKSCSQKFLASRDWLSLNLRQDTSPLQGYSLHNTAQFTFARLTFC